MGEKGALCILLMICIIGGAFLLGGLLFSRSVSTILQLVVAQGDTSVMKAVRYPQRQSAVVILTIIAKSTRRIAPKTPAIAVITFILGSPFIVTTLVGIV